MVDLQGLVKVLHKDKTGKYNKYLAKFLKANPAYYHVYANIEGKKEPVDWNNLRGFELVIGGTIFDDAISIDGKRIDFGNLTGKSLSSVLMGRDLSTCYSYCAFGKWNVKKNFVEITEEFWSRYLKVGKCLLGGHSSYIGNDNSEQFIMNADGSRTCKFCGRRDYRITSMEIKTEWQTLDDCIENLSR